MTKVIRRQQFHPRPVAAPMPDTSSPVVHVGAQPGQSVAAGEDKPVWSAHPESMFGEVLPEWGDEVDRARPEVTHLLTGHDLAFDESLLDEHGSFADVAPLERLASCPYAPRTVAVAAR
jgi:hypothetical protein